jgi:S1-C subfamily serine protease
VDDFVTEPTHPVAGSDAPAPIEPAVPVVAAEPVPDVAPEPTPAAVYLPAPTPPAPVYQQPTAPARRGFGRGAAVTLALLGVLISAAVGGVAGFYAAGFSGSGPAKTTVSGPPVSINATDEPTAAAASIALPSIVNIDVTGESTTDTGLPSGHPDVPSGGTGSGIAYKATGDGGTYILTNDHVVTGASEIVVTPASGDKITAKLIGTDPETDIAVVKVDVLLPVITIGDSEGLVVGQTVVAIGSPFGFQHSVSSGVVSALHRSITSGSSDTSSSTYPLVDVIQTDAAINPGNSGGALVDRLGRFVGMNSAIYTESGSNAGVGFAIPSKTVVRIADELIAGGKATHPFLGVTGRTVLEADLASTGLSKAEGAYVESVMPNTGAAAAALRKGDVVTALDGQKIRTMDDLILAVRRSQVGDKVMLTVWRNKASISVEMTVGDKPSSL